MSKRKLTLSIDDKLIKSIKHIAIENNTTVSALFEEYIQAINKNRNVIQAIKDMNSSV